jgi:RNA polymerase-binding transcription factor DksA
MNDQGEARARLESRLESLERRMAEMLETLREPEDDDLEEQAADLDEDVVTERLSRAARDEALLVREALKRMDAGTYGLCLSCGKRISARRLKALPEARTCLPCAQQASG